MLYHAGRLLCCYMHTTPLTTPIELPARDGNMLSFPACMSLPGGGMVFGDPESARRQANGAGLGFEHKLWAAADKMRGHMDPSEYKHVLLGLIFLKYISDAFDERHDQLERLTKEQHSE